MPTDAPIVVTATPLDREVLDRLVRAHFGDMVKLVGDDRCLEYTALIDIRPAQRNPGMEIADPAIRSRVRDIALRLVARVQGR